MHPIITLRYNNHYIMMLYYYYINLYSVTSAG